MNAYINAPLLIASAVAAVKPTETKLTKKDAEISLLIADFLNFQRDVTYFENQLFDYETDQQLPDWMKKRLNALKKQSRHFELQLKKYGLRYHIGNEDRIARTIRIVKGLVNKSSAAAIAIHDNLNNLTEELQEATTMDKQQKLYHSLLDKLSDKKLPTGFKAIIAYCLISGLCDKHDSSKLQMFKLLGFAIAHKVPINNDHAAIAALMNINSQFPQIKKEATELARLCLSLKISAETRKQLNEAINKR